MYTHEGIESMSAENAIALSEKEDRTLEVQWTAENEAHLRAACEAKVDWTNSDGVQWLDFWGPESAWRVRLVRPAQPALLDCGHPPTVENSAPNAVYAAQGYAKDRNGRTICLACAEKAERARFEECGEKREPFAAYLSGDEKVLGSLKITTWTGAVLADVISAKRVKTPRTNTIHGSHWLTYTARDAAGRLWYGRGSSGIATYLRRKGG